MVNNIYITLEGGNSLAYSQARSMSRCFEAYALDCDEEGIEDMEYVPDSNTFYILLTNSICISSKDGDRVQYRIEGYGPLKNRIWDDYESAVESLITYV